MAHQPYRDQIPFYIAQTLSPHERQAFERHLADCDACQRELAEWRTVAAAVWQETDRIARQVPPLSQDVYNRLQYRDRPARSQTPLAPPSYAKPVSPNMRLPRRSSRRQRFGVRLALVAGFVGAMLFGGVLVLAALYILPPRLNTTATPAIALRATDVRMPAQADDATTLISPTTVPSATHTPTSIRIVPAQQLPPTLAPTATAVYIPPPTSAPTLTPRSLPDNTIPQSTPATSAFDQPAIAMAQQGMIGPFITRTPGLQQDGTHLCYLFNPTDDALPLYRTASDNPDIVAWMPAGTQYRTVIRSATGWYQITVPQPNTAGYIMAWMPPETAYLRGSCDAGLFWQPTATEQASR